MRLGRIEVEGRQAWAVIQGDRAIEMEGDLFNPRIEGSAPSHPLGAVRMLAPVTGKQMFGSGVNFLGKDPLGTPPLHPDPAIKPVSSISASGTPIPLPPDYSGKVILEAECVAVIGRECRDVSVEEARSAILGYTCGNDVSHRGWRAADLSIWRAKGLPGFSPLGPWIETDFDPGSADAVMRLQVNGEVIHETPLSEMLFSFAEVISTISSYVPLFPGDAIWSGTYKSIFAEPGQTVAVEIPGIGSLVNETVLVAVPSERTGTSGAS